MTNQVPMMTYKRIETSNGLSKIVAKPEVIDLMINGYNSFVEVIREFVEEVKEVKESNKRTNERIDYAISVMANQASKSVINNTSEKSDILELRNELNEIMWEICSELNYKKFNSKDVNIILNATKSKTEFDYKEVGKELLNGYDSTFYQPSYFNTFFNRGYGDIVVHSAKNRLAKVKGTTGTK